MIISLRGLGAFQVEPYVQAVASAMRDIGYDATVTDPEGPTVQVCMREGSLPQLCTRLEESGTPWVIYGPSNIANIQAGRYEDMYGEGEPTSQPTTPTRTASTVPASFSFSNDTTGNRSLLRVGDRWTLRVTGAPNSDVVIVGGPGGSSARNTMGQTNGSGVWSTSGSPGAAEIGSWSQQIFVAGVPAGTLVFQVVAAPQSSTTKTEDKTTAEKLAEEAEKSVVPSDWMDWVKENPLLLVGGAAALFFVMGRGK